jgi:hypothetical protein
MNDEQWWAANAPLLARVLDEEAYPLARSRRLRGGASTRQRA